MQHVQKYPICQILKGLPRSVFEKHVRQFDAAKHCKGFRTWDQLVALMYVQISGASSLKEVEAGFNSQKINHYHLGTRTIRRSTLADANHKRPAALFEGVCQQLMAKAGRRFRQDVGDFLYLLDSTPIPLKGLGYDDGTKDNHSHRTPGLKVHVMVTSDTGTPVESIVTAPSESLRHCLTELRAGLFQRKETDHERLQRRQKPLLEWQRIQGALPL